MNKLILILGLFLMGCATEEVKRDRFFLQGNIALKEREYDKAIGFYTQALIIDKDFARAYNNRGVARIEDDHPYEAIQDYNMAILLDSSYYDAIFNRAYAYEQVGRTEDALSDLGVVKKAFPDSAYVYFYEGLLQSRLRAYAASMLSFQKALTLDPDNQETLINMATLHYFQEQMDSAKALLNQLLLEYPNEASALNTLSQVYLKEGNYQNALTTVNQALTIQPSEPYFLNNRGQIYLEMDELDLAAKDINRSILLDPSNAWAYRNKGIYFLKSGDQEQAIRLFQEVIGRPEFVDEVYSFLGKAYLELDQLVRACESWQQGIEQQEAASQTLWELNCR